MASDSVSVQSDGVEPLPSGCPPGRSLGRWIWLRRWTIRLVEFGAVQAVVQVFSAIAGMLIVRSLAKEDYALFAITNSMQTAANVLADLGIGIGVRSIGGRVWHDPERFGQLLNTALSLRRQFALGSLAVTVPVAGWMLWRNGASPLLLAGLCLCLAIGVIPLLGVSVWNVCLQMHSQYRRMQQLDLGNALLRAGLIALMSVTRMNALLAATVGVVGSWVQMIYARRWARGLANPTAPVNAEDRRELIRLSLKSLPNAVFFCLQGQITLLILTLVDNPTGISDITAIGRIAALFAVFSAIFISVIGPRFAQCREPARLPRLYLLLVVSTLFVLGPIMLTARWFPEPLLWALGEKYAGLGGECVWVMATGCVAQVVNVLHILNSCKAWFRVQSIGYIPAILIAQVVAALNLDLRHFHDVLVFNLVTVAAPIPVYAWDAWLGMRGPFVARSLAPRSMAPNEKQ